jgi:hypothetical protein
VFELTTTSGWDDFRHLVGRFVGFDFFSGAGTARWSLWGGP